MITGKWHPGKARRDPSARATFSPPATNWMRCPCDIIIVMSIIKKERERTGNEGRGGCIRVAAFFFFGGGALLYSLSTQYQHKLEMREKGKLYGRLVFGRRAGEK